MSQFNQTYLYIIAVISGIVGALFLFLFLRKIFLHIKKAAGKYDKKVGSVINHLIIFLLSLVFLLLSSTIFALILSLRTYQVLTKEVVVGELECFNMRSSKSEMLVKFTPILDGERLSPVADSLKGDMWAIDANIIKWDKKLNFLGLHTFFKLKSLYGKYENLKDEEELKHTVIPLYSLYKTDTIENQEEQLEKEKGYQDKLWKFLLKYGDKLPFVEATYGSSVFQYPSNREKFIIKISITGLTLKKEKL